MIIYPGVNHSVILILNSVSLCVTNNYTEVHGDFGRTTAMENEIMEPIRYPEKILVMRSGFPALRVEGCQDCFAMYSVGVMS